LATPTPTLSQLLGLLDGAKADAKTTIDRAHKACQRQGVFDGMHRVFAAMEETEDGRPADWEPPQIRHVQTRAGALVDEVQPDWVRLLDAIAAVDATNAVAKADVILADGTVLARDVLGVTLLALERQITDLLTFVEKLPVLPPDERWTFDGDLDAWVSSPSTTFKTKKIEKGLVVVPATKEHPAQAKTTTEDVRVGTWTSVKHSGAASPESVREMRARARALQDAVRGARQRANAAPAVNVRIGDNLLRYVFNR
jgi:hypothetical protein